MAKKGEVVSWAHFIALLVVKLKYTDNQRLLV